jgi:DinB family protein
VTVSSASDVFLDCFARVRDSLHRVLGDLTDDELNREPHPSIGWLAWRLTRVQDSNVTRLSGRDQLWLAGGWAARFGMAPRPDDFGRSVTHTREQVRAFHAPADLLLAYHDATHDVTKAFIEAQTEADWARELDEPQFTPLPTVAVRMVSVLENAMHNTGQLSYLKAYHRLGGWFPSEGADPSAYR